MAEHAGAVRRREDPRLITGAGEVVDDLRVPGGLDAAMLRSPHAHARIRALDGAAARRGPRAGGVHGCAGLGGSGLARGGAHPLEPRSLVAQWKDARLTVWGAVQMVHRHRGVLADQLGLPEEHVRVIAPPDVGGGFGTKGMYYPEYIAVAELARQLGRPVKWIQTRREHTLVARVEPDPVHDGESAAPRAGRLLRLR